MDRYSALTRRADVRSAVQLEYITLVWMAVELCSAVALGLLSGSLLLLAFGLDSLIELVSGAVVLWRLRSERDQVSSAQRVATVERRAARWTGYLLFALAAYVIASSVYGLVVGHRADAREGAWGLVVVGIAIVGMPVLAHYKRRLAAPGRLDSKALRADAAEAMACAYLSAVVVVGLVLSRALGWWWLDSAAALALLPFVVSEAREAITGETETGDD